MRIFISYRQNDSPGDCRQLCERLQQRFGDENVFFDVHSIKLGENWWTVAREKIKSSDVLLVPIGQNWLSAKDKNGRRRLDDPRDPLRREISLALEEKIRMIPVLVERATMPEADQLPEEIREFADLNACELRHRSFSRDVDALIEDLAESADVRVLPDGGGAVPFTTGAAARQAAGGAPRPHAADTLPPPPLPPDSAASSVPGQYGVPGTAPGVAPPGPYAPPPPVVSLTGMWQSPVGAFHSIQQHGNVVMIECRNQFGVIVLQGQGTLTGNQLYVLYNVTYQPPFVVRGEAHCVVSPDGTSISGQLRDPGMGVQPLFLRRVG